MHIRESVVYNIRVLLQDPNIFIYGSKGAGAIFSADGFDFNLNNGVFIQTIIFV